MPAFKEYEYGVDPAYQIPAALWEKIKPILSEWEARKPPKKKPGRPRMSDHQALTAVLYVLRTGGQWKALPRSLGAKSTVHDRLGEWQQAGVFEQIWKLALEYYDQEKGIQWEWQSLDAAMTKAPLGGEKHGQKPDGPEQVGREAERPDRWGGSALGDCSRGSEPARQPTAGGDASEHSGRPARSSQPSSLRRPSALVSGCGL